MRTSLAPSLGIGLAGLFVVPVVALIAVDGEETIGAGGLAWNKGRAFIWFHMERPDPAYRFVVFREFRKMLKRAAQLGEREVFTIRDPNIETSPRLLKLCGFEFHSIENGQEVHRCAI